MLLDGLMLFVDFWDFGKAENVLDCFDQILDMVQVVLAEVIIHSLKDITPIDNSRATFTDG